MMALRFLISFLSASNSSQFFFDFSKVIPAQELSAPFTVNAQTCVGDRGTATTEVPMTEYAGREAWSAQSVVYRRYQKADLKF